MTELVTTTLQRIFARQASTASRSARQTAAGSRDVRPHRPDFAETRPLVFRSEAFAEDLALTHGAV
jgi:hypothetical protein